MSDKEGAGVPIPAPKKRPGRKPKLDPELVAAALAEYQGNVSAVARRFSVDRSSVQELIDKRPNLRAVLDDARESLIDTAESSLHRAVQAGEAWAVCFTLKTQGKKRGYVERQEVSGPGGSALPVAFVEVPAPKADAPALPDPEPEVPGA